MIITAASASYIQHCRTARRLSEHTLRAYRADLADFIVFLKSETQVGVIGKEAVREYARELFHRDLKSATVRRRLAVLRAFFQWLEQEGTIPLTPFHRIGITVKQPHRLPRALAAADMRALIRRAELEADDGFSRRTMHFIVASLFITGLRISELASVRIADIVAAEALIQVRGKGNRERRVYFPGKDGKAVLNAYLQARKKQGIGSDFLLVDADGKALSAQTIRRRLAALARRAGITRRVTPHMLRHTAATQLIEAGVDIRFVQKLLGHASIATTQIYTQVSDTSLRSTLEKANTLGKMR